jgi:serine/threonine protein kinase
MTDLSGRDVGGYRLLSLIGRGGMGEVYRARDAKLGRDVAIKVLPVALGRNPDRLARFEREARLLAALNHPNIAAIYGTVDDHEIHGLVLELVEGETLKTRIAFGLTSRESFKIAAQIADALDVAHDKGIVHRDLKPENVKVTEDGGVKVLDFGIGKMAGSEADTLTYAPVATSDGAMIGTAAYMSPEQARGRVVDKRADIWAFGCVLYEMLTRRRAFAGSTVSDSLVAVLEREPDWSALPAGTEPSIRHLLARCLEKDVKRRLRDIGDAKADLDDAINGVRHATLRPPQLPGKQTLVPWAVAAVLVAALVLLWRYDRMPLVGSSQPPRFDRTIRLTNTPAREFGPAISPDGKWVAYYSDVRGPTDIWVKYLDSGATLNLTSSVDIRLPSRANIGGLSITPDGKNVAFYASTDPEQPTYDTWVIPAPLGGIPHKLMQGIQGVVWSPDGKRLACILPGSALGDALLIADADGSNSRQLIPANAGRHIHWPVWSADGRSIYFIYTYQPWNTEQSEIYRINVDGGPMEAVVRSIRRAVYPVPLPGGDLLFSANPDSVETGLWWKPSSGGAAQPLATGLGEYAESRLSSDGRKLVSMVIEQRQSLVSLSMSDAQPVMRPLSDGYGGDLDPSQDPTSDRIVFSSTRSGQRNLWAARTDGSDARPLTSEASSDHHPAFSPDGRQIAFVSDRGGQWGIWVMSATGGPAQLVTPAIVLDSLSWSRDGTHIMYSTPGSDRPTALAVVSVADGKTRTFPTPAAAVAASWSPTTDTVAYLEPSMESEPGSTVPVSRILLKFTDGQGRPLYPNLPMQRFPNGLVKWAPDGRRVAVATVPANRPGGLWIVEPEGKTPFRKVIEFPSTMRPRGLTWTRDGSAVIVAQQESLSDLVLYELSR